MKGKRYSRQRELIYQTLMATDQHPTAEMIYNWLKPENPSLSLGTVYRNLNLLADEGSITRMAFPVERYDANIRPHPHFQCRGCGHVIWRACPMTGSWTNGSPPPAGTRSSGMSWCSAGFAFTARKSIDFPENMCYSKHSQE